MSVGTITESITYGGNTYSVSHEGHGGWSTTNYMSSASVSGVTNPFYNSTSGTFDFSYYMRQTGFRGISVVSIYLGTNSDSSFAVTLENLDAMIASIHDYDSSLPVLINTYHQAARQDGFGNHNGLLNSQNLRTGRLEMNRRLIDHYSDSETYPNVYVSDLYFNVDGDHDYSTVTQALSARNPDTIVRQNNNVHPSVYGYLKFADSIYNKILDILT